MLCGPYNDSDMLEYMSGVKCLCRFCSNYLSLVSKQFALDRKVVPCWPYSPSLY